jgi:DNA polymerase-3 subunit delta'
MAWQSVLGHDEIVERFRGALRRGRLASTFLFVGPEGVGKRIFARKFAQALLCQTRPVELLDPCGQCDSCVQVQSGVHPDLLYVSKPEGKSDLPLALLIGEDDQRMRTGLCHDIALKPFMGGRRIAIIDDADDLNQEGANCLLKTLEEPPPKSVIILLGTSAERQLPTIRSRAQMVRFRPLAEADVATILQREGLANSADEAKRLASHGGGSVARAMLYADEDLWQFRGQLSRGLSQSPMASRQLASETVAFVEAAGKEASERRLRASQIIEFAIEHWREALRTRGGEAIESALERTLDAAEQVGRNANPTTLIECWFDDLARIVDRHGWRDLPVA